MTCALIAPSASEWLDDFGLSWLETAPKIRLLSELDKREPYPLSFEEQDRLFSQLLFHLKQMALFAANTGCRDQEICCLRWEWEVLLPNEGSAFIIPRLQVKNREERLVVLNKSASTLIELLRGQHPEYVFTYKGRPITHMLNTGWKKRVFLPDCHMFVCMI